ncbi:MAG: hypothetical protein V4646_16015 [Pseudomonadota bacterium]
MIDYGTDYPFNLIDNPTPDCWRVYYFQIGDQHKVIDNGQPRHIPSRLAWFLWYPETVWEFELAAPDCWGFSDDPDTLLYEQFGADIPLYFLRYVSDAILCDFMLEAGGLPEAAERAVECTRTRLLGMPEQRLLNIPFERFAKLMVR